VFLLVEMRIAIQRDFLALVPCTNVLQTELIHLYLMSTLLPGHLPILTSVVLRLLY
jgi:tRNA 2-selenouridine synthase SelU